jgi:hypothetical protein
VDEKGMWCTLRDVMPHSPISRDTCHKTTAKNLVSNGGRHIFRASYHQSNSKRKAICIVESSYLIGKENPKGVVSCVLK